jgi:hypothetical protein
MDTMKRSCITALAAAVALAVPASTGAASFVATFKAPNHHPKAGKLWYISVTARTQSGKPVRAVAWYEYYYQGQKVATRNPSPNDPRDMSGGPRPWAFKGSYRDGILWPQRSVGIPLKFRVVVKAKGLGTRNLDWKVVVRK